MIIKKTKGVDMHFIRNYNIVYHCNILCGAASLYMYGFDLHDVFFWSLIDKIHIWFSFTLARLRNFNMRQSCDIS